MISSPIFLDKTNMRTSRHTWNDVESGTELPDKAVLRNILIRIS